MGSWNATCALSNLPILPGEDVVQIILTKNPYDDGSVLGCSFSDFWFPRTLPLYGTYADYGRVDVQEEDEYFLTQILAGFKVDGIKLDHVVTWEDLQDSFHDGKVFVDKNYQSRSAKEERLQFCKTKFDKMVEEFGEEVEPDEVEGSETRNSMRTEYPRLLRGDLEPVETSPCVSIMIRRDIWDSLCNMHLAAGGANCHLPNYSNHGLLMCMELENLRKTDPDYKSASHAVHSMNLESQGKRHSSRNPVVSSLTQLYIGQDTPSFQFGPKDMVFQALDAVEAECYEVLSKTAVDRYCTLIFISRILAATRRAWCPTVGQGSQSESWQDSFEYHMRCATVVNDLRKPQLQDEIAEYAEVESGDEGPSQYQTDENEAVSREMDTYLKWARILYFDGSVK